MKRRQLSWRRPFGVYLVGIIAAASVVVVLAVTTLAQSKGSITASLSDERGAKVANADVRLVFPNGSQLSTRSDLEGAFEFRSLDPGDYFLEVNAKGFAVTAERIRLDQGEVKQLRLELRVAAVNESVVVTATGLPQRSEEVAKVLSVLDSRDIEDKRELTIAEALRGIPAVRVQQQGSPGALTTVRLRGQRNFDTSVLLDGLRIRDAADINGSAVSLISDLVPLSVERVEILRGSGSSIYGTNAIGGVINLVPSLRAGNFHFDVGMEGGGLGTFRERIQGGGGGDRFAYSFGISRLDVRRGIDGEDQYGNSAGAGRIQFNPTPSITVAGNFYGTIANARLNDSPFALPAAFGSTDPFPQAVPGVTFQPDFNNPDQGRRNRLLVGAFRFSQRLSEMFSYTIAYQRALSNRRNYNGPAVDPRFAAFVPFGDFEFLSANRGTTDTVDGRLNLRPNRANNLTGGFELEFESMFQQSIPSFSSFNNTTDRQRTFAVFGQDQIQLFDDRLQVSIGVRAQFYRIRAADRPGFLNAIRSEKSVTADGAVAYFFRSTGTKLRAHVGNGFRAPSLFERFSEGVFPNIGFVRFGDPTLKAEQSISVDGGIDQRLAGDKVLLGTTYFYTRLQRVIRFTGFSVDPLGLGRFSGYANEPGGLSRGMESYIEARPGRGTEIRASYTYTNSDRNTTTRGLIPEYVIPEHLFGLTVNQSFRSLLISLDLNRTGSYLAPVFENNFPFRSAELTFPGYTKVDLFGGYDRRISEQVTATFFAGADNLLNQKYFENGFRAPGIVGRAGVTFRFR
ncbi:MAG TPA: TonB-dependent receptor [Pyrinomonadaceae bacterium]|nr:TonB-dependent receptor [Pyrinomonadaceae bacterium]